MSTAIYTPCHTPASSQDFLSFHTCLSDMREPSFASPLPRCQRPSATPPRKQPLLLTPSPLRRRTDGNFDLDSAMQLDFDDFSAATGISTPFHQGKKFTSSPRRSRFKPEDDLPPFFRPPDPPAEEDEGLFLRSSVGHISLPLRTPQRHRFDRSHIPTSIANVNFSHAPKRKINRLSSSPNAKLGLTPLHIRHAFEDGEPAKRFATLAPLPAPRFLRERNSVGSNMGRQVDTLKEMRLSDRSTDVDSDSGSEEEFSSLKVRRTTNRSVRSSIAGVKVASQYPDGQVNKRRTRSRPVSLEFTNAPTPAMSPKRRSRASHRRNNSNTSVGDAGSPIKVTKMSDKARPGCERRLVSSATLFFGPAIVYPDEVATARPQSDQVSSLTLPPSTPAKTDEEPNSTSPDSSFTSAFPKPADTSVQFSFTLNSSTASPGSRIPTKFSKLRDSGVALSDDEMDEMFLPASGQLLPPREHARASPLPQPSGSITTSSEATLFDDSFVTPSHEKSRESNRPASPVDISFVDEFIVKTLEAGTKDGAADKRPPDTPQKRTKTAFMGLPVQRPWASAAVEKMDRTPLFGDRLPGPNFSAVMDSGGSAGDLSVPKKASGLYGRPRKSCPGDLRFPSDEGLLASGGSSLRSNGSTTGDAETSPTETRLKNSRNRTYGDVGMGRPSAKFNTSQFLLRRSSSGAVSTTSDGSEGSVTGTPTRCALKTQRGNEFRVPLLPLKPFATPSTKTSKLMPLSPNSPSALSRETPGVRHSIRSRLSILGKQMKENRRPESVLKGSFSDISGRGHSNDYNTPLPSIDAQHLRQDGARESLFDSLASPSQPRGELGRFEREFVEVDKIGSGEFGSAIKVRFKDKDQKDGVYAVKRSKRFEGSRHRLRLMEEVEILQHLSAYAGPNFHPNVLGYVDSWEQDDKLYILTELCEFGNFAHFLEEYGRHFSKLEEARVWKILAEISSGLRFMHMANVVHFDLKPANVFITAAGRFKIGDFGMASLWPRTQPTDRGSSVGADGIGRNTNFEREGDKMYLAAEVLQGRYGKETDIFSFGMIMLETATNICVPTQGEPWHRLREQDFGQVEGFAECTSALQQLIMSMMSKDPTARPTSEEIYNHSVVSRARAHMEALANALHAQGETRPEVLFKASPLAGVDDSFLPDILSDNADTDTMEMDWSA